MPHVLNANDRSSSYSHSSSDASFDPLHMHSRSASGTSETQYDALDLPPKAFMDEYLNEGDDLLSPTGHDRGLRSSPSSLDHDPSSLHLLVESAAAESQFYDILSPEQLDALRYEESTVSRSVEALKRKLYLESKVRNAAHGLSRLSAAKSPGGPRSDEFETSSRKCEELARDLWRAEKRQAELREQHLRHTAGALQLHHQKQLQSSRANGSAPPSMSDWFNQFGGNSFADTADGIIDLPDASGSKETDAMLSDLWGLLRSGEEERQNLVTRSPAVLDQVDLEIHNDSSDGDADFSHAAFADKVHRLCQQANQLTERQIALKSQFEHASQQRSLESSAELESERSQRQNIERELQALQNKAASHDDDIKSMHSQLADKEALINTLQSSDSAAAGRVAELDKKLQRQTTRFEEERSELESEIVRLQTEVTVARAELDGAYGTRAQRAAEVANSSEVKEKVDQLTARNTTLEKEMRDLVTEHESLVQEGITAERDREGLERTIDELKDQLESLHTKMNEDKVMGIARNTDNSAASPSSANEGSSMGVMRSEFKKIMRDARAEHFRALRVEQEERRRLEGLIRSLRKEQGIASPSTLAPPSGKTAPIRSAMAS